MYPHKAQVVSGPEARYQKRLFRLGRCWLFDHPLYQIAILCPGYPLTTDRSEVREEAFSGRLYPGDRATYLMCRLRDLLCRVIRRVVAEKEMVADKVQERFVVYKIACAPERMAISPGGILNDEMDFTLVILTDRITVSVLIAGMYDDTYLLHPCGDRFVDEER